MCVSLCVCVCVAVFFLLLVILVFCTDWDTGTHNSNYSEIWSEPKLRIHHMYMTCTLYKIPPKCDYNYNAVFR